MKKTHTEKFRKLKSGSNLKTLPSTNLNLVLVIPRTIKFCSNNFLNISKKLDHKDR